MNLHDWIDELSDVLDLEDVEVDEGLLADLTKLAANNVERMAAPVTAYLLGFAAAEHGADPDKVEQLAARAQVLAEAGEEPAVLRATLDGSVLAEARRTNPSLANRRLPSPSL